uniref:Uncharacterized protein n=1 Tax=Chromera velia CCMP2878 TaxID=1169474 RepID=A0A0G4HXX4_9ALVE|mmetsp:Transcript_27806/g.54516  ORF Transcript_27806/g.54516 Transcript_27806/m.54516 type:complete len:106 (+) Transcript_27806:256-573(+)|eukprot:Cvel_9370.t1-p1 / transcript=Cvel_9370.t1 / gene=Cvel_9370 / organism=Chromera_velia_CCMP2878 / gene_product=hypothetical protein / transcript_product=hypothetical protein / location=Cvel_scaffold538:21940-24334(-) / protein_length=105 / sequence_SO=supercontig / SO=protein_coding / is_pseudo=false
MGNDLRDPSKIVKQKKKPLNREENADFRMVVAVLFCGVSAISRFTPGYFIAFALIISSFAVAKRGEFDPKPVMITGGFVLASMFTTFLGEKQMRQRAMASQGGQG